MLDALLGKLSPQAGDVLVFLGDLVDRRPDSPGVVRAVRDMAENAPFEVVLIEGNHEELHRRYRRNLIERPEIAAEQADRHCELATLNVALSGADVAFWTRLCRSIVSMLMAYLPCMASFQVT